MSARTLRLLAVLAVAALTACNTDAPSVAEAPPDPSPWRLSSGKPPSKAEFAALAATCQAKGAVTDTCLTDLGLKRAK